MNKSHGRTGVLLLLLFIATGLTACSSDAIEAEKNNPSVPTAMFTLAAPDATVLPEAELESFSGSSALQNAASDPTTTVVTGFEPTPSLAATSLPPASEPVPEPAEPALIQHTVQSGETLIGIATKYHISMAAIQLVNGMGDSIDLMAGQTLSLPRGTQWLGENLFWIVHVVKPGESLVGLASTYGLTVDEILRVNAVADPALIHIDQQLVVPLMQLVTLNVPQRTPTAIPVAAAPTSSNVQAAASAVEPDTAPDFGESETTPAPEPPPISIPPPGPPAGPGDWPDHILARINQVRVENGLHTLTLVAELSRAAQAHAEDCAGRGWGSHVGSDGAVLKTRLDRAGYSSQRRGENWVQALDAELGFVWWYGEVPPNDAHRRNILSPHYTEIGIGIAETHWGYIFVTDFGRR